MINILCEYIKYQLEGRRRHGIHSPFVYDFGDRCLKSFVSEKDLRVFKNLKSSFLKDQTSIQMNDDKTDSSEEVFSWSIRQISKMSGMNSKIGKLLFRLTSHYQGKNVLELGTDNGLGTYMLSSGNKEAEITTVEANQELYNFAESHFPSSRKNEVIFINDSFNHFLETHENTTSFDLVSVNINQRNIDCIEESLILLEALIHDETIILINGIRRNNELFKIWKKSINKSHYHLSIDLFRSGILLRRQHQQKEHFVIRY